MQFIVYFDSKIMSTFLHLKVRIENNYPQKIITENVADIIREKPANEIHERGMREREPSAFTF